MVNVLPIEEVKQEVIDMYDDLPRNKRKYLYNLFLNNPNQPFHHGIQDGNGTWFHIATGDYIAPISSESIDLIIDQLVNLELYSQQEKDSIYRVYYDKLLFIHTKPEHQVAAAASVASHDGVALIVEAAKNELLLQEQILDISKAPHIGTLDIEIDPDSNHNSISWDPFLDGEELVRLDKNNTYIYHIPDLQEQFNSRIENGFPAINPLSGNPVKRIERFRLHVLNQINQVNGGRYYRKKKKTNKSKTKSRKTKAKKTRKH
jgi:hypothetical protein